MNELSWPPRVRINGSIFNCRRKRINFRFLTRRWLGRRFLAPTKILHSVAARIQKSGKCWPPPWEHSGTTVPTGEAPEPMLAGRQRCLDIFLNCLTGWCGRNDTVETKVFENFPIPAVDILTEPPSPPLHCLSTSQTNLANPGDVNTLFLLFFHRAIASYRHRFSFFWTPAGRFRQTASAFRFPSTAAGQKRSYRDHNKVDTFIVRLTRTSWNDNPAIVPKFEC